MSENLHRLVYVSRNRLPGLPEDVADAVRQILRTSQRNNRDADVTGALLFSQDSFGQVLEGPREAVEETFERIQLDERHGAVTVLASVPVTARAFPAWSMAFVGADGDGRYGAIADESGYDPARMDADALLTTLVRFVGDGRASAA